MKKISKSIADSIQLLRFPLIVGIVATHSYSTSNLVDVNWTFYDLIRSYCQVLFSVCVPSFFFISGLLFFSVEKFSKSEYLRKLRSRIRSLFLPYILWTIIAFIYLHFKSGLAFTFSMFWAYNSWNAPLIEPLWYVRNLMIFVVLSPILYHIIRYTKGLFVLFLFMCYLLNFHFGVGIMYFSSLLFFSLGSLFGILKIDISKFINQIGHYFLIIAFICSFLSLFSDLSLRLYCSISIFAIFYCALYFVEKRNYNASDFLVRSTFFIYALHGFAVTGFYMKTMSLLIPDQMPWECLLFRYFGTIILTVSTCLFLFYLLNIICPKFLNLLIGSR